MKQVVTMEEYMKMWDKTFQVESPETFLLKWNCVSCEKENREKASEFTQIANFALSHCYNCGSSNIIELKTKSMIIIDYNTKEANQ